MRLTSDFWVSALIRTVEHEGGFAYLARRGASEAGAIFIRINSRFGTADLYGPAPQTSYEEDSDGERMFLRILTDAEGDKVDDKIQRELRFDSDLWLVELENISDPAQFFAISTEGSV